MPESSITELKQRCREAVRTAVANGELVRPSHCQRCERVIEVHAHHDDYSKPLQVEWVCRQCHAAEHASEPGWVVAAKELRATGKTYKEIGELLGHSTGAVYKRLNPEMAREANRRTNAKRRAAKRKWENAFNRDPANRGECQCCGGLMGIGTSYDGICRKCRTENRQMSPAQRALGEKVAEMWRDGASLRQIAEATGLRKGTLGQRMDYWRGQGLDLPYRYGGDRKYAQSQKSV